MTVALLDDAQTAAVATANFDNRSFRLNFRITAVVIDPTFALQIEQMFEADFARSRLVVSDDYEKKTGRFKVAVRASRLTASLL